MSFTIFDAIEKERDMDASLRWHDDREIPDSSRLSSG